MRTTTGLLLVAAILVSSLVPPGHGHAHAGGEELHDHYEQNVRDHSLDGHHPHDHHATDHNGVKVKALGARPIAHVHLSFGLFDLMLPVHDESETEDDEAPVYVVRLVDDCLPLNISGQLVQSMAVRSLLIETIAVPQAATHRAVTPPDMALLLCDVARHERSGVQLF